MMRTIGSRRLAWTRAEVLALCAITAVGAALRLVRLTAPGFEIGDEKAYAKDACWYLYSAADLCETPREGNLEHPTLGKWLLSLGIRFWGYDMFGIRIVPVVIGIVTIPLLYLLARKVLDSRLGAGVAAGALALDFMHLVHSRLAMLDVFLVFFVVLAFLFLATDRDTDRPHWWWRYAAGAAAGAAIATKWSGLFALAAIALMAISRDVRRHDATERHAWWRALRADGLRWVVAFALIPALVYVAAFFGRVHGEVLALPWSEGSWLSAFWHRQAIAFDYHAHDIWTHRYASPPWSWPVTKRGIPLARAFPGGDIQTVTSTGNPVLWVLSVAAVLFVAARWLRNLGGHHRGESFIVAGFAWAYLPWLLYFAVPYVFFTYGARAMFIWYLLPALPFMYLALGYVASLLRSSVLGRIAMAGTALFAVAALAYVYPMLTAIPIAQDTYDARLSLFDDCDPTRTDPAIYIESVTTGDVTAVTARSVPASYYLPAKGWCWK